MLSTLTVFLGAGLGGSLRHGVNLACGRWCGTEFPIGTLIINVIGCFSMGLLAGWVAFRSGGGQQGLRLFLTTGILGGFTTFSSFSLQNFALIRSEQWLPAIVNIVVSVIACLVAVALGHWVAERFGVSTLPGP